MPADSWWWLKKNCVWNRRSKIVKKSTSGKPFIGSSQTLVVVNLVVCNFYACVLFCALLRPFALFADLRLCSFADICALLRSFACFCERLRLERPRFGTPDSRPLNKAYFGDVSSRAHKPWSAHCELKHWNFRGWKCLIHGLHFMV